MYNQVTMRHDIYNINQDRRALAFHWENDKNNSEQLTAHYPYGRNKNNRMNDLAEYCWQAYHKAFFTYGPAIIGRQDALSEKSILDKYKFKKNHTLWISETQGNILVMDKWSPVMNDAWLLGGVHRHADFRLMSYLAPTNLWNDIHDYHIVMAREVIGLLGFGYKMIRLQDGIIFKCLDYKRADNATLPDYHHIMHEAEVGGMASIYPLITEPALGLLQQIRTFKKTNLRSLERDLHR
jgi:hypothetical protein